MVLIDTVSFKVDDSVDHLATDWEVSDSIDFENILLSSYEDYKNKTGIIFSENLNTNVKYYARARGLLTTGYTKWGNIDVFSIINDADLLPQDILPTRVSVPILNTYRINTTAGIYSLLLKNNQDPTPETNPAPDLPSVAPAEGATGANQNFDDNDNIKSLLENTNKGSHDLTLFEIWATGFETIGTAKHLATTWWIENKDGDVIWSKIKDQINLTRIEFNNTILKSDEVYRIKAVFHTNSNDVSQIGSMTIVTGYCGEVELVSYLDAVDASLDLNLQIAWLPDLQNVNWEILSFEGNLINSIWATTTSSIIVQVPKDTLKRNTNYILRISTNLADCFKYIPFVTTATLSESPNDPITPLLVYPTDLTIYKGDTAELFVESEIDSIQFINNNPTIFEYDEITHLIRGIKRGSGSMTIIAKKEGFAENYTKINISVEEDKIYTPNNKYVRLQPLTLTLKQGERATVTATTNCEKLTFELSDDKITVNQLTASTFDIVAKTIGTSSMIVLGYNSSGETASSILDVTIEKGSIDPDEPEEPEKPIEYTFEVDKTELEIAADGGIATVNVITNAIFWDVMSISHPKIVDVEKASVNTLRLIGKAGGTSRVYLVGSDGEKDVGDATITITVGKVAHNTTFTPLDLTYHTEINTDVIIDFASNITTTDEYTLKYDTALLELKLKGTERMVFSVKESAAGQTIPITVRAEKTESDVGIYAPVDVYINVVVKNITHAKSDVIRLPDASADGNRYYSGTTYENNEPFAPNPIPYRFYVNENVLASDITITSPLWEDKTGELTNMILSNTIITDKDSKFKDFKEFTFDIITNPDDKQSNKGIVNSNHIYDITARVSYDNDIHIEKFTLSPLAQLYLSFILYDPYINKGSKVSANITTNAFKVELNSTDKTKAILAKGEYTDTTTNVDTEGYYIEAKDYGEVKLTAVGKNVANEAIVGEQTIYVIDPDITTELKLSKNSMMVVQNTTEVIEFTTNADKIEYDYDTQFIEFDEASKTIKGLVVGDTTFNIKAIKTNGRPVEDSIEISIVALSDLPSDIETTNDALIVSSENEVATEVTIFRGLTLTTSLNPDLGKVKVEDITPPDPTPTEDQDEDTDEEVYKSVYKVTYTAPLTTIDREVKLTLNTDYRGEHVASKDVTITVNKKNLPTGMKASVDSIELEALDSTTFTVTTPDDTNLTTSLDPNLGTITKTEK